MAVTKFRGEGCWQQTSRMEPIAKDLMCYKNTNKTEGSH